MSKQAEVSPESRAERLIGCLIRDGEQIFYVWGQGVLSRYKESTCKQDLIDYVIRKGAV